MRLRPIRIIPSNAKRRAPWIVRRASSTEKDEVANHSPASPSLWPEEPVMPFFSFSFLSAPPLSVISRELYIANSSVKTNLRNIYHKAGVGSLQQLIDRFRAFTDLH